MSEQRLLRTATLAMLLLAGSAVFTRAEDTGTGKPTVPVSPDATAAKSAKSGKTARPDRPVQPTTPEKEDPAAGAGLGAVGKVLPIGEKNIDVKIPSFKDGIPSSTVRASSMTRLDEENMSMERMDIRLYGKSHQQDVRIQLPTALYHMPSQILSSDSRSRITREDFDLQGDSMIFDTRTGQGKMVGNVRMVIYDSDSLMGQKNGSAPAPEEKSSGGDNAPSTDNKSESPPAPAATPATPPPNEK
jgi:hypothetical protein